MIRLTDGCLSVEMPEKCCLLVGRLSPFGSEPRLNSLLLLARARDRGVPERLHGSTEAWEPRVLPVSECVGFAVEPRAHVMALGCPFVGTLVANRK